MSVPRLHVLTSVLPDCLFQDTVISLQALSEYASSHSLASQVDFSASGGAFAHAYSVSKANEDILHEVEVCMVPFNSYITKLFCIVNF